MRWTSAFSAESETIAAAREVADAVARELNGAQADLVIAFFDSAHLSNVADLTQVLRESLAPGCLLGVSAHGVISTDHEVETSPALSVIAASLPGVEIKPFVMVNSAWVAALDDAQEFERCTPGLEGSELVMLFADPFTFDIERCLGAFNIHAPGMRVVGGMASAGVRPGSNTIVLNDWTAHEGGIGLALKGALRVDVVVSQGCRPVGPPLQVTRVVAGWFFHAALSRPKYDAKKRSVLRLASAVSWLTSVPASGAPAGALRRAWPAAIVPPACSAMPVAGSGLRRPRAAVSASNAPRVVSVAAGGVRSPASRPRATSIFALASARVVEPGWQTPARFVQPLATTRTVPALAADANCSVNAAAGALPAGGMSAGKPCDGQLHDQPVAERTQLGCSAVGVPAWFQLTGVKPAVARLKFR